MVFAQQFINRYNSKIYNILIIAFILGLYGFSVGINLTGFALFLDDKGLSKIEIGSVLSMELIGNLVVAPILNRLTKYFGIFKVIMVAITIRAISLIIFTNALDMTSLMIWLFLFGISGFSTFASIQYWGATVAKGYKEGTIISILNLAFAIGIALGASILTFYERHALTEILRLSALISGIIAILIVIFKHQLPILNNNISEISPTKIIQYAQIPILCGLVSNYLLVSISNFIVLYAISEQVPYIHAVSINIYMILGNLIFTVPIGILIDKFNKIIILIIISVILLCSIAAIPFGITDSLYRILIFTSISAAIGGIYVIGLTNLAEKFNAQNLALANTMLLMMNAIGGFSGVASTGAAIEYWGNNGLIISLFVLVFFFLLFIIYSQNSKIK